MRWPEMYGLMGHSHQAACRFLPKIIKLLDELKIEDSSDMRALEYALQEAFFVKFGLPQREEKYREEYIKKYHS